MISTRLIKICLGFVLIFFGLFFMILDRYSCRLSGGLAKSEEFVLCIKLFMFVGIIFVVCGSVLLIRANIPFEFEHKFDY